MLFKSKLSDPLTLATGATVFFSMTVSILLAGDNGKNCRSQGRPCNTINSKTIETFISQLRSSNSDPNPRNELLLTLPPNYDYEVQAKIETAVLNLTNMGKNAFYILIEHVNDKYYSRSEQGVVLSGQSVGMVCFKIIEKQVDIAGMSYKSRIG